MSTRLAPRLHVKDWAARYAANPVARVLVRLHVHPNAVTLAGLAVAVVAAYFLSEGRLVLGGAVFLGGAATDMLDGAVARLGGRASAFGALLDSVADRLGEAAVLFGLLVFYVRAGHELGAYLAFGAMVTSVLVSYLRARTEGLGLTGDVGLMGRPERVVVLGAGLLVGYPLYAMGVVAALASVTIAQRMFNVLAQAREE